MKNIVLCAIICAIVSTSGKAAEVTQSRLLSIGAGETLTGSALFSADKRLFAAITYRYSTSNNTSPKTFRVWSTQTAKPFAQWKLRWLQEFALSPNGRVVAVITGGRQRRGIGYPFAVELRDIYSGKVKRTIIRAGAIDAGIYSLAWSPDGKLVATGSGDGLARIWNAATGRRLASLRAGGSTGAVQFSVDGKALATVGENPRSSRSSVKLWDWRQKKQLGRTGFRTYSHYATLAFSPDNRRLAVGDTSSGLTTLFDTRKFQELQKISAPSEVQVNSGLPVPTVTFASDGRLMAFASVNDVVIKNVASKRTMKRYNLKQTTGPHVLALKFLSPRQLYWITVQHQYDNETTSSGMGVPKLWHARW